MVSKCEHHDEERGLLRYKEKPIEELVFGIFALTQLVGDQQYVLKV